jgi:RNA polymerase sigma factor (sigma-70 family)
VLPPVVDETWAAVQRLPGPRRTAVVLRYYADLSYDQIAEAMGCPVGTAKSHVHRGLQELREVLDA